jgi:hypothetical protein
MFLLLLTAGTLYLIFGELQEGLILFGFVLVTLGLTLDQEGKAERAITTWPNGFDSPTAPLRRRLTAIIARSRNVQSRGSPLQRIAMISLSSHTIATPQNHPDCSHP